MRGLNVTTASPASRFTCTRATPGTPSSADRTATMHPSQIIPATANVTVADCGDVRHALMPTAIVNSHSRLVISVSSEPAHHSQGDEAIETMNQGGAP